MNFSIGEFAKLINVTTETLRHYDRIGLFKPIYKDKLTGYRYYSILQYEKLGTIKELRDLDMNLIDIKTYFDNKNLENSIMLLEKRHIELKEKINKLNMIKKNINSKIIHLKNLELFTNFDTFEIKQIPNRYILISNKKFTDNVSNYYNNFDANKLKYILETAHENPNIEKILEGLFIDLDASSLMEEAYSFTILEGMLNEISPLLGSNRIGIRTTPDDISNILPFILLNNTTNINVKHKSTISGGKYLCMLKKGCYGLYNLDIKTFINDIKAKGYIINGDILQIMQVDLTVTDLLDEIIFEIQVPII